MPVLALMACQATPTPPSLTLRPASDVIYKIEGDIGFENWLIGLQIEGPTRFEHRHSGALVHAVEFSKEATAAQDGAFYFQLPAALGVDELRVEQGGTLIARVPLARYRQHGRYRLPLEGCWFVSSGHDFGLEHRRHLSRGHFAWDFVRDGGFGQTVVAPADGVVVAAATDWPDNAPGATAEHANFIQIDHGAGEHSRLVHLMRGSVRVRVGDFVRAGQPIASVGNSGMSDAPHLHLAFQTADDKPLPVALDNYGVTRGRPRRGQRICARPE